MSDAVLLAKRGVSAVSVATEQFAITVGRGMARAQGYPDFPIVSIPGAMGGGGGGFLRTDQLSPVGMKQLVEYVVAGVEEALLAKKEARVESGKKLQKKPR